MVYSLREIIESNIFTEKELLAILQTFNCTKDKSGDIKLFLTTKAIDFEESGDARTYLIIDESAGEIIGFFTLAIKALILTDSAKKILREEHNILNKNQPAYLIGQLAKADSEPRGVGKDYLEIAISKIKEAHDIVGGRFIYLDCKEKLCGYYQELGFKHLSYNEKTKLYQMYISI